MHPCQLIYRSIAHASVLNNDALRELENQAKNNNRRLGVSGLLALSNGRFLQLLEGTPKFVNEIFLKIVRDKRHHGIELISFASIAKTAFIDWDMKIINLDDIEDNVRNLLIKKYPTKNNAFQFTDDAFLMSSLLMDLKHIYEN